MRKIGLFFILSFFTLAAQAQTNLTVRVIGMEKTGGKIMISLFTSEDDFMKKSYISTMAEVKSTDEVLIQFENIPEGTYAISMYHDENSNENLDANFVGIPKEPYGFSNNARGKFGPAAYKDCKFEVKGKEMIHEIRIK